MDIVKQKRIYWEKRDDKRKLKKRIEKRSKNINNHSIIIEGRKKKEISRQIYNIIKAFLKKTNKGPKDILVKGIRYKHYIGKKNEYWIATDENVPSLTDDEMIRYVDTLTGKMRAVTFTSL